MYRDVFQIVNRQTKEVIHEIDVSTKGQRTREKVADGLMRKVDFERFFVRIIDDEPKPKKP